MHAAVLSLKDHVARIGYLRHILNTSLLTVQPEVPLHCNVIYVFTITTVGDDKNCHY